ncbi:MAG: deoxynucleoside kinase [Deltaproteobacteria bacterium]|nr:deoxynucleoside kinase [Deltaproteobacteria bacterium]
METFAAAVPSGPDRRAERPRAANGAGHRHYIAITGSIGVGKSTLTDFLCRTYKVTPFFEPNDENPYLADFYADMRTWAFRSQLFFLTHKFRIHQELDRNPGTVVQDRTIYEDAEIFARNLHLSKHIDARDWAVYQELYRTILRSLRPPDLMIYLRCNPRTQRQRIRERGRDMEQSIPTAYLKRLGTLYEEWFARFDSAPKVVIETDRMDYLSDLVHRLDVLKEIERHLV